jgi:methionyl-tRNA formyltransferase
MVGSLERPIRVVFFGGPYLQPGALRFVALMEAHPEIDLVLGLCEGEGAGLRHRWRNLRRRRGAMAATVFAADVLTATGTFLRAPGESLRLHRAARRALERFDTVPDVHDPAVLERVRASRPDLGVIYGAPILKPDLFGIPSLGTLGIHHGRVPEYRGKKTTFWEIFNGEAEAGITVQRVNPGIDTGEVVRTGAIRIGSKTYGRVWREVEELGCELFVQAVIDFKRGTARPLPQQAGPQPGTLYRQPSPRDLARLWWSRLTRQDPPGARMPPGP